MFLSVILPDKAAVVPSNVVNKFCHSKWQTDHPHVYSKETDHQAQNEGRAEHETTDPGADRIAKDGAHVKVGRVIQFSRIVFRIMKLDAKGNETANTACDKWEDGIGRKGCIIHVEPFADDDLNG